MINKATMDAVLCLNVIYAPALLFLLQIFEVIEHLHEILQNNRNINREINTMTQK
jgi:hypothetical protein